MLSLHTSFNFKIPFGTMCISTKKKGYFLCYLPLISYQIHKLPNPNTGINWRQFYLSVFFCIILVETAVLIAVNQEVQAKHPPYEVK